MSVKKRAIIIITSIIAGLVGYLFSALFVFKMPNIDGTTNGMTYIIGGLIAIIISLITGILIYIVLNKRR